MTPKQAIDLNVEVSELMDENRKLKREKPKPKRNIRFEIKSYYSEELGRIIEGEVSAELKGREFGPKLRAHILYL